MTTVRDVAAAAKVSPATVSRVLNNATVDPAMEKRVKAAVARLGYRPNPIGRALRNQRSAIWAFIAPDIEDSFFTSVLRGMEDVAVANERSVMVCNTSGDAARESNYVRLAIENHLSGVVLTTSLVTESAAQPLTERGIPVVLIDTVSEVGPEVDTVLADNVGGAKVATTHLIEQGCERVACVAGPKGTNTAEDRLRGYREALAGAGRAKRSAVARGDFHAASGRRAAKRLLDRREPPDGIFVSNSQMAAGVLREIQDRGLSMPDDVAMVTFDDEDWTSLVTPPITVVRQPTQELGRAAAEVLLHREAEPLTTDGDGAAAPRHIVLPTELVPRASSSRR